MNRPQVLPLLPLRGLTVFPHMTLHFDVSREMSVEALDAAMREDQLIFLVTQIDLRVETPHADDLYTVGTVARVRQVLKV
ncbi:MAG: LON peptidase substrate-binding domain-containing protein, partial [Clostridia bacterium]|nr:LON peptidase substrate-binding domain-containing protein [Clostridia bacterium]